MQITSEAVVTARGPWRQIGVLALIGLLIALAAIAYVGSRPTRPTLPPPFGLAGNGVIALEKDGDILVADRPGGDLRPLVAGPEADGQPMLSPDGTRLAFVRDLELGQVLMVADADGTNVVQLTPETLDAHRWSFAPDSRSLVGLAVIGGDPTVKRVVIRPVDPAAALTVLDIQLHDGWMDLYLYGRPSFRPTNPQEILVVGRLEPDRPTGIHVYDLATGDIRTIRERPGYPHSVVWSPTGEHISYDLTDETSVRSRVVAADGTGDRALANARGTSTRQNSPWSNDGTRIVLNRQQGDSVVVSTGGEGEAVVLACGPATDIECALSWIWSPDDSMLIGLDGETPLRADPETGHVTQLDWDGGETPAWQRVAP